MVEKKSKSTKVICTNCINCKKKGKKIYCKIGFWSVSENGNSILHTPFDFDCNYWEEV